MIETGPAEKLEDPLEDEFLKQMKEEYCFNKTREVQEGRKYSCKLCNKAFKSPEFVVKHIKNKHDDRLNEKFNYVYFRGQARDNYLDDPNRISNVPQVIETNRQNSLGVGSNYSKREYPNNRNFNYNSRHMSRSQTNELDVNPESEKGGDGQQEKKPFTKEYIDYDDPTQFGKGGQRLQ